ncbi:MAG TPA: zinc ribbon domain-containing protein [Gemmatimonadaceae bacterium]|nr:zinc ribbon domain-containing protein [Gemmatimonadaceae bacterium]
MFRPKGPNCQSCGMPLSKDPLGGGSNSDGSPSTEYCSHCYRKGTFTQPNVTPEEMMKLVEGKLRSMHFPGFLARRFARDVPNLRRWRGKRAPEPARAGASELQPRA